MNCPQCNKGIFVDPVYKDSLCRNKDCSLYLKGDVFVLNLANIKNKQSSEDKIKEIMEEFDFEKVHKVMVFLDWQWRDEGVPSIAHIKMTSRRLLEECIQKGNEKNCDYHISTGGFSALYYPKDEVLVLEFKLDEWTAGLD